MKLLSFASALLLLNGAASQICPNSIELGAWGETFLGEGESFIFRHAIILASNPNESSILCGRLETIGETYIAFGISPAGTMEGGEAIIGLPDPDSGGGTVKKYTLSGSRSATEMPPEKQTLMYTTVTQEEGRTVMEFAKYLKEDGDEEHEIDPSGVNTFIYALGTANTLGYHSVKGSFTVEFDATLAPTPFQTAVPTPEMSGSGTQGGSSGGSGDNGVSDEYVTRTASPTSGVADRGPPRPTVSPTAPTPTKDDPSSSASSPSEPTPPADSAAMVRKIAGTMVMGAGVFAVWFGM